MKLTLAAWYMETAWMHMGPLRNVRLFHRLFNLAYGARKQVYIDQIIALPEYVLVEEIF